MLVFVSGLRATWNGWAPSRFQRFAFGCLRSAAFPKEV